MNKVTLIAIVAAGLIAAALLMWTGRKADEVRTHIEVRESAAAAQ